MKKALATIMGLAFAVSAMAQYLIYDYTVSFKRIDAQFTKVSYQYGKYDGKAKNYTGYFDSFKTASDKLIGYVVVPKCEDCGGAWDEFGSAEFTVPEADSSAFAVDAANEDAYIILTRNGDNLAKNPYLKQAGYGKFKGKVVWILQANIDSAMFGKGAAVRLPASDKTDCKAAVLEDPDYEGTVTSLKAAKEAWLVLTYEVPVLDLNYIYNQDEDLGYVEEEASDDDDDDDDADDDEEEEGSRADDEPTTVDDDEEDDDDADDDGEEEEEEESDESGVFVYPPVKGFAIKRGAKCPIEKIPYGFLGYLCRDGNVSNAGFGTVKTVVDKGSTNIGFCGTQVVEGGSCSALNSISGSTIGFFNYVGFCSNAALFDICTRKALTAGVAPMAGTFTFKMNASLTKKMTKEGDFLDNFQDYLEKTKYKSATFAATGIWFAEQPEEGEESGDGDDEEEEEEEEE